MLDDLTYNIARKNLIVLGCAGMMAGYTRMTYSLGVILMETSQTMNLFVPIIFTIIISNQVGYLFTRSLYERGMRGKQFPVLQDWIPEPCQMIIAEKIMSPDIVSLERVSTLRAIKDALNTNHHSFPVLNAKGNLIGMMPRNFIITLLQNKTFYTSTSSKKHTGLNSRDNSVNNDSLNTSIMLDPTRRMQQELNLKMKKVRDDQRNYVLKRVKQFVIERRQTTIDYTAEFDDEFPATPEDCILPWQAFTRDLWSVDMAFLPQDMQVCDTYPSEQIDLRPYMIENPYTVFTTDKLEKCVSIFRKMHLRHLVVIHPSSGNI